MEHGKTQAILLRELTQREFHLIRLRFLLVMDRLRQNSSLSGVLNFGQDSSFAGERTAQGNGGVGEDFYYTPPAGFKALTTDNLSDPSIADPTAHFSTVLYAGNSTTSNVITTGFQPDLVWLKNRGAAGTDHGLTDSVRGVSKSLFSNTTGAETVGTGTQDMYSFNSTGFTVGTNQNIECNTSGYNYASWNWKGGGTAASNGDGSINVIS